MAKKFADVVMRVTISFDEDESGESLRLIDQAHEAAMDKISNGSYCFPDVFEIEIVGPVRDKE